MSTREVLREEWGPFFDQFSSTHMGRVVSLEMVSGELGSHREAHNLPLEGISADFESGLTQVTIAMGGRADRHVAHTVLSPLHVWLRQDEETGEDTLELETRDSVTLVRVAPRLFRDA